MNTKSIASLFVLLAIVSIVVTVPSAYAAHATEATVSMVAGSSMPGCEETDDRQYTTTFELSTMSIFIIIQFSRAMNIRLFSLVAIMILPLMLSLIHI